MKKWLGNHLVSSNNKNSTASEQENKHAISTTVTFSWQRRESAIIRKIGEGTLEKEGCVASWWRAFCPHLKYSVELLIPSTARNSPKKCYNPQKSSEEGFWAEVLHHKCNSTVLNKASAKYTDPLVCHRRRHQTLYLFGWFITWGLLLTLHGSPRHIHHLLIQQKSRYRGRVCRSYRQS